MANDLARAWKVLRDGIGARAFPGAVAAVIHGRASEPIVQAVGRFTYDPESPLATVQTVYDLASLTKVIATTSMAMLLCERGSLDLEMPVAQILPEFLSRFRNRRRQRVSFRHLLEHSSGLPEDARLWKSASDTESALHAACGAPLDEVPGTRTLYSDLGFVILGVALERIAGETLDTFCSTHVFAPAGMVTTCFMPPEGRRDSIPPTGIDHVSGRVIQGVVNNRNARAMGGVAGHVGLFSNVVDIARFAQVMLRDGAPIFLPETVARFTRRAEVLRSTSRALGWDTPQPPAQCGKYFGRSSFGHLGATGTSLWIDPERKLAIVLLTNRTWPDRANQLIKEFRPRFHDAVVECLA